MTGHSEPAHAERRQLTVSFIDLAGSTDISSRLDPEDFRNLILAFQESVSAVIERHDGYIARFLGDGILVYYGYPKAHENDAERAVRAGLGIIDAVRSIDVTRYSDLLDGLEVRIGIMTGPAVVGDIVGEGASQEATALGEIPNIAARLQSIAEPNQLVIGDTTKSIVEGLFEFEELGSPELKGVGRPVPSFLVRSATEAVSRFDRSLHLGLSQLVGRRRELEVLEQAWEEARTGGKAVAVIADAGIGKSRLIHEFSEQLGRDQAFFLCGHCIIDGETIPLHPFVELLRTAFQIRDGDTNPDDKLRRGLEILGLSVDEHLPHLLNLLGRPPDSLREVPAELLGTRARQSLQQLFRARCSRSRVLLVLEDLHWADHLSEELVNWILAEESLDGMLLLMSYRPVYRAPWKQTASFEKMKLVPLSPHSTGDLIRLRLGDAISETVVSQVIARAEGNPLFAEELANFLIRNDGKPVTAEGLPANLESLLLDRIDSLEHEPRNLLQAASIVGRQFTIDELERVSGLNGKIAPNLSILQAQDLIFPESNTSKFRFKHALVRDAVYHNLLREDREALHLRLAESLESDYSDRLDEVVDEIADHYARTNSVGKTMTYLARAGEKSLALYSLDAANVRFQRVLELDRKHPGLVDDNLIARMLLKLARVYYFQYEFKKLIDLVDEYLPRIEALGDDHILGRFLFETGYAHVFGAQQAVGKPLLERAYQVAEACGDEETIGYACMGLMWHHMYWEEPSPERRTELERLGDRAIEIGRQVNDVWLISKTMLAFADAYWIWGLPAESHQWDENLGQLAQETDDPRPLGLYMMRRAFESALAGDLNAGMDYANECLRTSISPIDLAYGNLALAFNQLMAGSVEESAEALIRLRQDMESKGMIIVNFVAIEVSYAFNLLLRGDLARAVLHLEQEMKRFTNLGQPVAPTWGHLYLGQIFVMLATSTEKPTWEVIKRNLKFLLVTMPFADRYARRHLEYSCAEARRLDCPGTIIMGLLQLIQLHRAKGRDSEATTCLAEARDIAQSINAEYLLASIDTEKERSSTIPKDQ